MGVVELFEVDGELFFQVDDGFDLPEVGAGVVEDEEDIILGVDEGRAQAHDGSHFAENGIRLRLGKEFGRPELSVLLCRAGAERAAPLFPSLVAGGR